MKNTTEGFRVPQTSKGARIATRPIYLSVATSFVHTRKRQYEIFKFLCFHRELVFVLKAYTFLERLNGFNFHLENQYFHRSRRWQHLLTLYNSMDNVQHILELISIHLFVFVRPASTSNDFSKTNVLHSDSRKYLANFKPVFKE